MEEQPKMEEVLFSAVVPFSKKFAGVPHLKIAGLEDMLFGPGRAFWELVINKIEGWAETMKDLSDEERATLRETATAIRKGLATSEQIDQFFRRHRPDYGRE